MNARYYREPVAFVSLCLLLGLSAPAGAQSDWKKQWETTIEAGRKEGEVVIYGPHNPMYQQLWAVFQKSFPVRRLIEYSSEKSSPQNSEIIHQKKNKKRLDKNVLQQ